MRCTSLVALAFTGTLLGSIHTQAQIIQNGSFESPTVAANTRVQGTAGDDWTVSGTAAAVDLDANDVNVNGNTTFGSQYLELYGPENSDAPAVVSQLVTGDFTAGKTYTLEVDYADLTGNGGALTLDVSGGIFFDATLSKSFTATAGGPYGYGDISFQTAEFTFIPFQSGTATVSLEDLTGGGDLAIDDVLLIDPSVPEPASVAEVLAGFGALAGVYTLRRRRA